MVNIATHSISKYIFRLQAYLIFRYNQKDNIWVIFIAVLLVHVYYLVFLLEWVKILLDVS